MIDLKQLRENPAQFALGAKQKGIHQEGLVVRLAQAQAGANGDKLAALAFAADAGGPVFGVVDFAPFIARAEALGVWLAAACAGDWLLELRTGKEAAHCEL